jgi:hypothetical protein
LPNIEFTTDSYIPLVLEKYCAPFSGLHDYGGASHCHLTLWFTPRNALTASGFFQEFDCVFKGLIIVCLSMDFFEFIICGIDLHCEIVDLFPFRRKF